MTMTPACVASCTGMYAEVVVVVRVRVVLVCACWGILLFVHEVYMSDESHMEYFALYTMLGGVIIMLGHPQSSHGNAMHVAGRSMQTLQSVEIVGGPEPRTRSSSTGGMTRKVHACRCMRPCNWCINRFEAGTWHALPKPVPLHMPLHLQSYH